MPTHADNMSVDSGFDALKYGYATTPRAVRDPAIHGERDLWCAVIAQAFMDMGAIAPPTSARASKEPLPARGRERDEAVRWLLRDKTDFPYICDLAGVSPHIIRCAARIFHGSRQLAMGAAPKG